MPKKTTDQQRKQSTSVSMGVELLEKIDAAVEVSGVEYDNRSRWIVRAIQAMLEKEGALEKQPKAASPATLKTNQTAHRVIVPVKAHAKRS